MPPKSTSLDERSFFLGIGAQKSGTSWLHAYFAKHPDVYMLPLKEMHFFDNRDAGEAWPIRSFRRKLRTKLRQEKLAGKAGNKPFTGLRARIAIGGDINAYRDFIR